MKLLKGSDLVDFIKVRQAQQVRQLRQAYGVIPRLVIFSTANDPVIETYIRLKRQYGNDILIDVEVRKVEQAKLTEAIQQANVDSSIRGIIVQLPLLDPTETTTIVDKVASEKDVDGLANDTSFDPATPTAVNWLLAGYNIDLRNKQLCIVGKGRLVGKPLADQWKQSGYTVSVIDKECDLKSELRKADVIVSATGQPRLITSDMIPIGSVVVDAGSADEAGRQVGDVSPEVYERDDLIITPRVGGVGPLTVAALFDNVLKACYKQAK